MNKTLETTAEGHESARENTGDTTRRSFLGQLREAARVAAGLVLAGKLAACTTEAPEAQIERNSNEIPERFKDTVKKLRLTLPKITFDFQLPHLRDDLFEHKASLQGFLQNIFGKILKYCQIKPDDLKLRNGSNQDDSKKKTYQWHGKNGRKLATLQIDKEKEQISIWVNRSKNQYSGETYIDENKKDWVDEEQYLTLKRGENGKPKLIKVKYKFSDNSVIEIDLEKNTGTIALLAESSLEIDSISDIDVRSFRFDEHGRVTRVYESESPFSSNINIESQYIKVLTPH